MEIVREVFNDRKNEIYLYYQLIDFLDNIEKKDDKVINDILFNKDIEKIVNTYKDISEIQEATDEDLIAIKISRFKIKALRAGINRLKFTIEMQR